MPTDRPADADCTHPGADSLGERRFRALLAATTQMVWTADPAGRAIAEQPGWARFTGQSRAEYQGYGWLDAVHPGDRDRIEHACARAAVSRGPTTVEFRLRRADGAYRLVSSRSVPVLDDAGRVVEWVGCTVDVTAPADRPEAEEYLPCGAAERLALEQEREATRARLREEERLRERLIGILGHDLKNPLAAVQMTAQVLERELSGNPRLRQPASRLRSIAARMQRLVEQMLDFAQLRHAGGLPVYTSPSALDRILVDVVEELRAAEPGARIELDVSGAGEGLWDADRLWQVFSNLVGNAVQHGHGSVVEVVARDHGAAVVVDVYNEGPPIPPDLQRELFDPFRRGMEDGDGAVRSVGLGLYIVEAIVEGHLGQLEVLSPHRKGTTFRVTLPRGRIPVRPPLDLERRA